MESGTAVAGYVCQQDAALGSWEFNVFTDCGAIGLLWSLAGVIFFRELWIHNTLLSE